MMNEKDKYIINPTPYKAKDGSYHATMEEVEEENRKYWIKVDEFLYCPDKDIVLTSSQLEQIRLNPSASTLVSIIHQLVRQQLEEETKGIKR